jgi:thiamine biosynthesis lipoprotein ApbE
MGTLNTVVVADQAALPAALNLVMNQVKQIDEVCSRFRPESELSRLNHSAGQGQAPLSPLLEEAVLAGLMVAEMTGGLVDPTVGTSMEEIGYTITYSAVLPDGPPLDLQVRKVRGWQSLDVDTVAHTIRLPEGVSIDLGASGKAWAADRAADAVAEALGVGVLVECGGDVAVRGPVPGNGWPVRVAADVKAAEWQDVLVGCGGLATSGTTSRRWRRGGVEIHDIIDPATGLPAQTPWAMVTVAAATCLEANAAATAALIMGMRAPAWLDDLKLPARLVSADGDVRFAGGWTG